MRRARDEVADLATHDVRATHLRALLVSAPVLLSRSVLVLPSCSHASQTLGS
jgi:hypothetical protein